MPSNFPPGYSEDGDAPEHGRDTAIYQDLVKIREKYQKWFREFIMEFPNADFDNCAKILMSQFMEMEQQLNRPF